MADTDTTKCQFQEYLGENTKPRCKVTHGECQFVEDGYDLKCTIRAAFTEKKD